MSETESLHPWALLKNPGCVSAIRCPIEMVDLNPEHACIIEGIPTPAEIPEPVHLAWIEPAETMADLFNKPIGEDHHCYIIDSQRIAAAFEGVWQLLVLRPRIASVPSNTLSFAQIRSMFGEHLKHSDGLYETYHAHIAMRIHDYVQGMDDKRQLNQMDHRNELAKQLIQLIFYSS